MEEQLLQILKDTQSPIESVRKNAEWQLQQQNNVLQFPVALVTIGAHDNIQLDVRQSALLYLKNFVLSHWSDSYSAPEQKAQIRQAILGIALSPREDRKIRSAASLVVSKVANSDFPEQWPDLLPTVLQVVNSGDDSQLHGALKVLIELVEDSFAEEQFFKVARDLVKSVYSVAENTTRKPITRALAVSVFRSCFDTLEVVLEDHKTDVKAFAEETLAVWVPLFITTLKTPLPAPPPTHEANGNSETTEAYRGSVALKLQVVKVLMRIRSIFASVLSPHSPALFSATWQELLTLQPQYESMYLEDDRQGRLEDADGLPYTLDFLVLEELDFMQACFRAPPIRRELEQQLQGQGPVSSTWISEVMKIAVSYAHITLEEEGLWDIDVNVFLSEEANITTNYTPRTACGDLVIKLGEWQNAATLEGLLSYTRALYAENASWKAKEASLYLLNQLLGDFQDVEKKIGAEAANGYVDFIKHAMQEDAPFLRARGYLVAGSLTRTSGDVLQPIAATLMEASLIAITNDSSDVVKVSCIRALQYYLAALPAAMTFPHQSAVITALSDFINTQDMSELTESDDLLMTVVETLRDAIMLDTSTCLQGHGLDLLFLISGRGSANFQIALLVTETFEDIVSQISELGSAQYAQLAARVLPSLMGSFDVATLTEENDLANLSADLLSVLAEHAPTPLPDGFVNTAMPRLSRLLLGSGTEELLKSATAAVKHMLNHDPEQMFNYQDQDGKGGLELILLFIDRLLGPAVDDNAASEVGGLAAEVVEKAGSERLGPYLEQLLRGVTARVATAAQANFIQSLILVFARMTLISPREVVDFLAQVQIGDRSGLQIVVNKWLENSINFAGYEDIRQNVAALCKLYELNDQRLFDLQVKGDLIVPKSDRIVTRSRAKQTPDEYTMVPAQLKIIKVLVEELLSASGHRSFSAGDVGDLDEGDDEDEDDDWEDEPDEFIDLATGMSKSQLMALGNDDNNAIARERDDETQAHLLNFFREAAQKPGFDVMFNMLSPEQQDKLRSIGST